VGGCSARRPDIKFDLGSHVVIAEVDENKHEYYDSLCENRRMMEISQDVGHRPVVFIRFNPDNYQTPTGNVTSCWNSSGKIKQNKKKEWVDRLNELKQHIQRSIDNPPDKTVEVIRLFFDSP